MNSIEAIIALTIMLAGIGIILTSITYVQEKYFETNSTISAKTQAISCASIIDSIYSNSATTYNGEINCTTEKINVKATHEKKTKESQTTTETINELTIEVKTLDHYLK